MSPQSSHCALCASPVSPSPAEVVCASCVARLDLRAGDDGDDAAGLVCPDCLTFVAFGADRCHRCGWVPNGPSVQPLERCTVCGTALPYRLDSCLACGAGAPRSNEVSLTRFIGTMALPADESFAVLTLTRGNGPLGASFRLNPGETTIGRGDAELMFPDDPFLSPIHASFRLSGGLLMVRDLGSRNGVFQRVFYPLAIEPGDQLVAGSQLFCYRGSSLPLRQGLRREPGVDVFGSPRRTGWRALVHLHQGGIDGAVTLFERSLVVGRRGCHINLPADAYLSHEHFRLDATGSGAILTDLGSLNGTFLRRRGEFAVRQGDHLLLGQQYYRVEVFG
jgi:pSer/pThr/pTyr-binding forkhead associated (FHA) protein